MAHRSLDAPRATAALDLWESERRAKLRGSTRNAYLTEGISATSGHTGVDRLRLSAPVRPLNLSPGVSDSDGYAWFRPDLDTRVSGGRKSASMYRDTARPLYAGVTDLGGSLWLSVEVTPAKYLGRSDNLAMVSDADAAEVGAAALVDGAAEMGVVLGEGEPMEARVTRLDQAQDVEVPAGFGVAEFIRGLGSVPVPYATGARVYLDHQSGSAQTAYRGNRERGSRTYDKFAESGGRLEAANLVRMESQLRKRPLARAAGSGGSLRLGDLAMVGGALRHSLWDHFRYGATVCNAPGFVEVVRRMILADGLPSGVTARQVLPALGAVLVGFAGVPDRSRRRYLLMLRSLGYGVDFPSLTNPEAMARPPMAVRAVLGQRRMEVVYGLAA